MTTPIMTVMIAAIRKAARGVQRDYGEVSSLQVSVKGPADFVTNSDKKAEKVLREELNWFYSRLNRAAAAEIKNLQAEANKRENRWFRVVICVQTLCVVSAPDLLNLRGGVVVPDRKSVV